MKKFAKVPKIRQIWSHCWLRKLKQKLFIGSAPGLKVLISFSLVTDQTPIKDSIQKVNFRKL